METADCNSWVQFLVGTCRLASLPLGSVSLQGCTLSSWSLTAIRCSRKLHEALCVCV